VSRGLDHRGGEGAVGMVWVADAAAAERWTIPGFAGRWRPASNANVTPAADMMVKSSAARARPVAKASAAARPAARCATSAATRPCASGLARKGACDGRGLEAVLSRRELTVLELLPSLRSMDEIACDFAVSINRSTR
jgi:hypothetical protein